eukprot:CAMPEP_0172630430 /NCGR_PEP_ID=MMETSP1068-20121228/173693_1 /TAXON_ID=35684 /ORGANISM="Pseudopedinella elastica, Strain CCMP716" /LENGTH=189 /DNA_ID=CAMNT_0013441275 /DNA_START=51 /DNA_END=621 /DNA_ORIENTATION=+
MEPTAAKGFVGVKTRRDGNCLRLMNIDGEILRGLMGLVFVGGGLCLLLYFTGVIHSDDYSCIQKEPLSFGIAKKWKAENGWVCCDNEALAEPSGWWKQNSKLEKQAESAGDDTTIKFFDVSCGKLLYEAPIGRSMDEFVRESIEHGWPSFRKEEVVQENVRVLDGGEVVSTAELTLATTCLTKKVHDTA